MVQRPNKRRDRDSDHPILKALGGHMGRATSTVELVIVVGFAIFSTFFITSSYFGASSNLPQTQSAYEYNSSLLHGPLKLENGSLQYRLMAITDLDHDSKSADKKNTWQSIVKTGSLVQGKDGYHINWFDAQDFTVSTQIAAGGRAMELSDLAVFDGRLLTVDDRTGLIYEIKDGKAYPWLLLIDGPGNVTKGFKGEWMTVKNEHLYVGGLGKEWTTTTGEYVNDNPMWIKVISPKGEITHVNWYNELIRVRRALGIEYPGYMIHEAVQWSERQRKWFFLPRRASKETYDETADETRGVSVLIIGNEDLTSFKVVHIGENKPSARGFAAFQFIPGTNDEVIIGIKSEEKDGKPVASYYSVFKIDGTILIPDTALEGAHKFEGIAFI